VKIFMGLLVKECFDFRKIPKIMVCGPGTAEEFVKHGIKPDLVAEEHFGVEGLLEIARLKLKEGDRILRFRSDKTDESLACELRKTGASVSDVILYRNIPVKYERLPDFDSVVFASSSAAESFVKNWGLEILKGKDVVAIGKPTLETLRELKCKSNIILAKAATMNACIETLAERFIERRIG
jgi:uroporphyrinogen-III synthase